MSKEAKKIGLGFGLLGTSNVAPISDQDAEAMFSCAVSLGINQFDTAPLYGGGLSEERLGKLLHGLDRNEYRLSTKVGRYRAYSAPVSNPKENIGDIYDYGSDATYRSIEDSLERLRTDRLDIVYIHDCDDHIDEAAKGAYRALFDLKTQGVISKIGCGSNIAATHSALLDKVALDVVMVAGRFTLLDQSAASQLFPQCQNLGVEVILASPFNSGILAVGPDQEDTRFDYQSPDVRVRERVREIQDVCLAHQVTLKQTALAYSLAHPAVSSLMLGLTMPDSLISNLDDLEVVIPDQLWTDLAQVGVPHPLTEE